VSVFGEDQLVVGWQLIVVRRSSVVNIVVAVLTRRCRGGPRDQVRHYLNVGRWGIIVADVVVAELRRSLVGVQVATAAVLLTLRFSASGSWTGVSDSGGGGGAASQAARLAALLTACCRPHCQYLITSTLI
jgi:hypothetical protein